MAAFWIVEIADFNVVENIAALAGTPETPAPVVTPVTVNVAIASRILSSSVFNWL